MSKACANCRRRKIKCTGTYPCSNCAAYQCECIFDDLKEDSSNPSTVGGTTQKVTKTKRKSHTKKHNEEAASQQLKFDETNSVHVGILPINGSSVNNNTNTNTDNTTFVPTTPWNEGAYANEERFNESGIQFDSIKNGNVPLRSSENLPLLASPLESRDGITEDSEFAFSLNDQEQQNSQLSASNGLYEDDLGIREQIDKFRGAIKQLKSLPGDNPVILKAIETIKKQMVEYMDKWEPKINLNNSVNSSSFGPEYDDKSIETLLMKNKYRDRVNLTSFSVFQGKNNLKNSDEDSEFFSKLPLIDEVFGLYSPIQTLSLRGIGFLLHRHVISKASSLNIDYLKATVYMMLRFFDICCIYLNESCLSISNPLEYYLQRKDAQFNSPVIRSPSSSTTSPKGANNKDQVLFLLSKLPSTFLEKLTTVTYPQLVATMNNDLEMFSLLINMYSAHKNNVEKSMLNITSRNMKDPSAFNEDIYNDSEVDDILLTLCYSYYNATLYHLDEYNSLEYLEILLALLEHQTWLDEHYGLEKVLTVAVGCAYKMGLHRWEYYVGYDEVVAERKRLLWWRLYRCEKFYSLRTGELSSINDEKMNCLLFKEFRDVGFVDHKDFIQRVQDVSRNEIFDSMSITSLRDYGECALFQLTSEFFANVLYSEHFTSIRNSAKPLCLRVRLLNEVFDQIDILKANFDKVKEQTYKLFEIVTDQSNPRYSNLLKEDVLVATNHVLFQEHMFCTILSSANNLISRLSVWPRPQIVTNRLNDYANELYKTWVGMGKLLVTLENDYAVWRGMMPYLIVFLLTITKTFNDSNFFKEEDLLTNLRIFKRLENLFLYLESDSNKQVLTSRTLKGFSRSFSLSIILTRILLLDFMSNHNISVEDLKNIIIINGADVVDLIDVILDYKSHIYKYLLEAVQKSGLHLNVKQMLENDKKFMNLKKIQSLKESSFVNSNEPQMPVPIHYNAVKLYPATLLQPISPSKNMSPTDHPPLPSIKTITTPNVMNTLSPLTTTSPQARSPQPPQELLYQLPDQELQAEIQTQTPFLFSSIDNNPSKSYNLGTLEEFVNNTDLNDLYSVLWNDNIPDSYQ